MRLPVLVALVCACLAFPAPALGWSLSYDGSRYVFVASDGLRQSHR